MVRTGTSGTQLVYGMPGMERLHQDAERGARFDAAMSERTKAFAPSVADRYDFSGLRTMADIGGGQGVLLAADPAARTSTCAASCSTWPR